MIVLLFLLFIFAEVLYSVKRIVSTSEVVNATPSRYRVINIMFDQCENNVSALVNLTNPMKQPWFVELSGVIEKEMLTITVVMNVKMMKNSKRINHFDYSAFINGQWYSNRNHIHQAPEVLLQTYSTRLMKRDMRRMSIIFEIIRMVLNTRIFPFVFGKN